MCNFTERTCLLGADGQELHVGYARLPVRVAHPLHAIEGRHPQRDPLAPWYLAVLPADEYHVFLLVLLAESSSGVPLWNALRKRLSDTTVGRTLDVAARFARLTSLEGLDLLLSGTSPCDAAFCSPGHRVGIACR